MGRVFYFKKGNLHTAPMTGLRLGDISEGTKIKITENGVDVEFYVAKHDYESELNGTGRTLLVRNTHYTTGAYGGGGGSNTYADQEMDLWCTGTYKTLFSTAIQNAMGETTIYYTDNANGMRTLTTMKRSVFILSATEFGASAVPPDTANTEGSVLPIADTLKVSDRWTRSPDLNTIAFAFVLGSDPNKLSSNSIGTRTNTYLPAFTLSADSLVDDSTMLLKI